MSYDSPCHFTPSIYAVKAVRWVDQIVVHLRYSGIIANSVSSGY